MHRCGSTDLVIIEFRWRFNITLGWLEQYTVGWNDGPFYDFFVLEVPGRREGGTLITFNNFSIWGEEGGRVRCVDFYRFRVIRGISETRAPRVIIEVLKG